MSQIDLGQVVATVAVGTTTKGAYGSTPSVTNSGTTANAVLNFTIPGTAYPVTSHGTNDTTYSLTPNILHTWGKVSTLTLTLATPSDTTIANEYMFQFESGSTATTLSLPATVLWDKMKGDLTVEANKIYQISIMNNIGVWASINNS